MFPLSLHLSLSFSEPRTRRSFSRIHQQHRTAGGRNPIGQVRGRTMVKAVLRLWRWQYLDADVHGTLLRLREWDVLFQVSVSVCSVFYPSVHSVGTVTVELIANGTNITHNISLLLKQCIGTKVHLSFQCSSHLQIVPEVDEGSRLIYLTEKRDKLGKEVG